MLVIPTSRELIRSSDELKEACFLIDGSLEVFSNVSSIISSLQPDLPLITRRLDERDRGEAQEHLELITTHTLRLTDSYKEMCVLLNQLVHLAMVLCSLMVPLHSSFRKNRHHRLMKARLQVLMLYLLRPTSTMYDIISRKLDMNTAPLSLEGFDLIRKRMDMCACEDNLSCRTIMLWSELEDSETNKI